ncbi:MAG TPA: phytanoyl-CoA dioxygenase family protein [Acidimicrobiales bacterium]|nr:phytanoyl-CoA dioxygenase family protein [Acidimicrobiales bacterium]
MTGSLRPRGDGGIAPTFRDPLLEERFLRDGFVVLPVLTEAELEACRRAWERVHPQPGSGFEYDVVRRKPEQTLALEAAIGATWDRVLDDTLVDHERFLLSFLTKWPGDGSEHHLHQDWSYVDERRFRTMSYWIALDDTSAVLDNGPVAVIPGSQHLVDAYRGPAVRDWYEDLAEDLTPQLEPVDVSAGHAIVIDNALLHGSSPNRSERPRRAVAAAVAPRSAPYLFAAPADDDRVTVFELGQQYFAGFDPDAPEIEGRRRLGSAPRLVGVDHDGLGSVVSSIPPDLAAAPGRAAVASDVASIEARAAHLGREHARLQADGWRPAPVRFLPDWALGLPPDVLVLPLAADGIPTDAGRVHREVAAALRLLPDVRRALVVTAPAGAVGTFGPCGGTRIVVVLACLPAGSLEIGPPDRLRSVDTGTVLVGDRVDVRNHGRDAALLVIETGPSPRGATRRARRLIRAADEAITATSPTARRYG